MSYKLEIEFVDRDGRYEMAMMSENEPSVYLNNGPYLGAEYRVTADRYSLYLPFHLVRSIAVIKED